ncbi:MAG: hypothetical protein Q9169_002234 [Polycauliona sp. 2 TL-2023]
MLTPAGSLFQIGSEDNLTFSAFRFPPKSERYRLEISSDDQPIVWCCENSTTFITIDTPIQIRSNPAFDALTTLDRAIREVEVHVVGDGLQRLRGGYWGFALDQVNEISMLEVEHPSIDLAYKYLSWPVLRNGLMALRDFIANQNLTHAVQGLQFGIYNARLKVGEGAFA